MIAVSKQLNKVISEVSKPPNGTGKAVNNT